MSNGKKFALCIVVDLVVTWSMGSVFLAILDAIGRIGGRVYNYPEFIILGLVALYTAGAVLRGEAANRKNSLILLETAIEVTGMLAIQAVTWNRPLAGWLLLLAIVGGMVSVLVGVGRQRQSR